ncbi:MAG TPA: thioesterase family protein [Kofleriaceae bacterium]|nr:thioesterase family protein [Kofleriaceae bacterium]
MAASISDVSTPRREGETFRLDVPPGWRQGRGAFGGLTIGAAVRAIELRVADPRRKVRSVTAELTAPVEAGPAELAVDVLRSGSSVTVARAALRQAGEVRAHAVAVLAADRPATGALAWRELEPPRSPPWRDLAPAPMAPPAPEPEFVRHFEYRILEGVPLSGGDARCVGWIRPAVPSAVRDAGYIAALADAWFPAAMVRVHEARPMATIAYTLDLISELDGLDPQAPLLYRGTVPVCADGYFLETRELWGEDGRLVAINQQTFAIIA